MFNVKVSSINSPFKIKKHKSCGDKLFGTFDLFRQLAVCQLVAPFFRLAIYSK